MPASSHNNHFHKRLSRRDFKRLGGFIQSRTGIKMPPNKATMLQLRLHRRLNSLKMTSYKDYCDYLFSPEGMKNELPHLIDRITTNKTEFFREPAHFEYLYQTVLPELTGGRYRRLSIWSAGCSTGEEPYTLAMVFDDFFKQHPDNRFDYNILATDISDEVLTKAERGIYKEDLVDQLPMAHKKNYFLRSKDRTRQLARIVPEIRKKVTFRSMNLMDDFQLGKTMDIIFCRNVIIYFDKKIQEVLLNRMCRCLKSRGYIFMGHSEALVGQNLPLHSVAPTVYRKAT